MYNGCEFTIDGRTQEISLKLNAETLVKKGLNKVDERWPWLKKYSAKFHVRVKSKLRVNNSIYISKSIKINKTKQMKNMETHQFCNFEIDFRNPWNYQFWCGEDNPIHTSKRASIAQTDLKLDMKSTIRLEDKQEQSVLQR